MFKIASAIRPLDTESVMRLARRPTTLDASQIENANVPSFLSFRRMIPFPNFRSLDNTLSSFKERLFLKKLFNHNSNISMF